MDRRWTDPNCVRGTGPRPWDQKGATGCPPLGTPTCPLWSTQMAWSLGQPHLPGASRGRGRPSDRLARARAGQHQTLADLPVSQAPGALTARGSAPHCFPTAHEGTRQAAQWPTPPGDTQLHPWGHPGPTEAPGGATAGGPTESSRGWRQRPWHWLGQIPDTLQEPGATSPRHHTPADDGEPPWHQERAAGPQAPPLGEGS